MEIKIWSDIRCPFCYIGKRRLEAALKDFEHRNQISISWKSFQLDPNLISQPQTNALEHLADSKNISIEQAKEMVKQVTNMAKEVGLKFDFENAIVANSFNAHRLLHLAKSENKADEIKEALLKAHLIEGKNIDDNTTLLEIAKIIGLNSDKVKDVLDSDQYAYEVKQDEMEGKNLGLSGVPFFVFDMKYGISGAQPLEVFKNTLKQAWEEQGK